MRSFELGACWFLYIYIWRVCPPSLAALGAVEGFILSVFILMYLLDKKQKAFHLIFSNQRAKSKYLMSQTSINTEYNEFGFFLMIFFDCSYSDALLEGFSMDGAAGWCCSFPAE